MHANRYLSGCGYQCTADLYHKKHPDISIGHYILSLPAGVYTVLFAKEGYGRKFLSLVLQSDSDITADINMAPKVTLTSAQANHANLDLFAGIICEKIDADVVYSSLSCINSAAHVECLDAIIDRFSCSVVCNSKLKLDMTLEKNLVYKLNQSKEFINNTIREPISCPLMSGDNCKNTKCFLQVKHVDSCKEQNLVNHIAYLQFVAYLFCETDLLINGTFRDEN